MVWGGTQVLTWRDEELIGKTVGPGAGTKWWYGLRTVFVAYGDKSQFFVKFL